VLGYELGAEKVVRRRNLKASEVDACVGEREDVPQCRRDQIICSLVLLWHGTDKDDQIAKGEERGKVDDGSQIPEARLDR
jgi:hypothetical protein